MLLWEYAITVKNEGEVEGYTKKIVDYMPKELEFSTELNNSWYKMMEIFVQKLCR